jgi:hypothetical protein
MTVNQLLKLKKGAEGESEKEIREPTESEAAAGKTIFGRGHLWRTGQSQSWSRRESR